MTFAFAININYNEILFKSDFFAYYISLLSSSNINILKNVVEGIYNLAF